jgi:DNA topoisomerase-1
MLGNTKAVCRKCYIHPAILQSYLDGNLAGSLAKKAGALARATASLKPDESAVLRLLQSRLSRQARAA